jgi:hypothetical protein
LPALRREQDIAVTVRGIDCALDQRGDIEPRDITMFNRTLRHAVTVTVAVAGDSVNSSDDI